MSKNEVYDNPDGEPTVHAVHIQAAESNHQAKDAISSGDRDPLTIHDPDTFKVCLLYLSHLQTVLWSI